MSLSVHWFLPTAGHGREVAGFGPAGAGTALVDSHEEVAELTAEHHGFDHVILSGQPHLEEAWQVGDGVLPLLARAGVLADGHPVAPALPVAG